MNLLMEKTNEEEIDTFPLDLDIFPVKEKQIIHGKTINEIQKLALEHKNKRRKKTRQKAKDNKIKISNYYKQNTAHLSQEETILYYATLKFNKKQKEEQIANAINSPIIIVFDLDFLMYMKHHEIKSLSHQLTYAYRVNKNNNTKICFYFTSFTSKIKEELEKMGALNWHCKFFEKEFYQIEELMSSDRSIIYLSPDSDDDLETVDKNSIYIIGGLVDKPVIKNRSLLKVKQIMNDDYININQNKEMVITTKRLPLKKYVDNVKNYVLNINTVVEILSKYIDCGDWKEAIMASLPKRMII